MLPVHADLAASVRRRLEEVLLELARWLQSRTGETDLAMAGGVALNCVANRRLAREGAFAPGNRVLNSALAALRPSHGHDRRHSMTTPAGRVVATFSSYREAERAVDRLSDAKFPVERTSIVGRNPQFVEHVTGRFGYLDAMLRGALVGGMVGLLIGWLFAVFAWFDPEIAWGWLIIDGLWFGAVVGALAGLLAHALTRGRRDFASVLTMQADRYELLADEEVADEAARLLGVPAARAAEPAPQR